MLWRRVETPPRARADLPGRVVNPHALRGLVRLVNETDPRQGLLLVLDHVPWPGVEGRGRPGKWHCVAVDDTDDVLVAVVQDADALDVHVRLILRLRHELLLGLDRRVGRAEQEPL